MKKLIYCALVMIMTAGCLTGCGGNSSAVKTAVKTYAKAYWEDNTGELILLLVPEDYKTYLKNTYYVTESQLKEKCKEHFKNTYNLKYDDFKIVEKYELNDMQKLNEELSEEYNMEMSEKAYEVSFEVKIEDEKFANEYFDGEVKKERDVTIFEYQGGWYSYEAMGFLENAVD